MLAFWSSFLLLIPTNELGAGRVSGWKVVHPRLGESYLPVALGIIFVLVIIWLPLALRLASGPGIITWALVAVLLAILPALMVWLTYRR